MCLTRKSKRRYVAGGAAAAFAVAVTVPVLSAFAEDSDVASDQPAAEYELTELPVPDGFDGSGVDAVDPTGQYLVGGGYNGNVTTPLLWNDGEVEAVEVPDAETAYLFDVNSSGLAVGSFSTEESAGTFFYQDGEVTVVEGGEEFSATGVNEAGDVSGSTEVDAERVPAVWRDGADAPEELPMPDGWRSGIANDVNDDGVVAGYYQGGGQNVGYPLMWDADGAVAELELPDEVDDETFVRMDAIAGDMMVGHIAETPGVFGTLAWNASDGAAELLTEESVWEDVNTDGSTVGRSDDDQPAIFVDGELSELPGLIDEPSIHHKATGISEGGEVVGGKVRDAEDNPTAVVWTAGE